MTAETVADFVFNASLMCLGYMLGRWMHHREMAANYHRLTVLTDNLQKRAKRVYELEMKYLAQFQHDVETSDVAEIANGRQ